MSPPRLPNSRQFLVASYTHSHKEVSQYKIPLSVDNDVPTPIKLSCIEAKKGGQQSATTSPVDMINNIKGEWVTIWKNIW